MTQRLFGVGNIHIETAGESSRLTLFDVDKPQELADEIMNRVPKGAGL
jgi:membrane protein YdbS with pleckstrin-like domain